MPVHADVGREDRDTLARDTGQFIKIELAQSREPGQNGDTRIGDSTAALERETFEGQVPSCV